MGSEKIVNITNDNFEKEVVNSKTPVLVDFWAEWCGPCRTVGPIMEELAEDFDGKIKVAKVNVDDQGDISQKFRVMSIPTIILFKDGQAVDKLIGARQKEEFSAMVEKNI